MKYHVKRMTPEFQAIGYSLLIIQFGLLIALYHNLASVTQFFFGYSVLLFVSIVVSHQQTEIVDDSEITLP